MKEFLDSLDIKMQTKAYREIELLQKFGSSLREPHVKYLQDDIFELRIKTGSNISRIFYFFFNKEEIILTNGFIKKTQKTPRNELSKALKYMQDFKRRSNNGL